MAAVAHIKGTPPMNEMHQQIKDVIAYKAWPYAPHPIMAKAFIAVKEWAERNLLPKDAMIEDAGIVEQMENALRLYEQEIDAMKQMGEKI